MPKLLDRRRFVAGASATALVLVMPGLASADADDDLYEGRLDESIGPFEVIVTLAATGDAQRIRLEEGAYVQHGLAGVVDDLATFVPGERVVFRSATPDQRDVWPVNEFQSLFGGVTTRVTEADADRIVTEAGPMLLAPVAKKSMDRPILPGTTVHVTFWTDPRSGRRYAEAVVPRR